MKLHRVIVFAILLAILFPATIIHAQPSNLTIVPVPASSPVYIPNTAHENDGLPDGVLAWNSLMLSTNLPANTSQAHFLFSFTNISSGMISVLDVHPSCGCTTAELPSLPWNIAAGGNGQIPLTVNISGKTGTFYKTVRFATDKGTKQLLLQISVAAAVVPPMTAADRARGIAAAKIDRQAVFHNDCATCHVNNGNGKYGKALYDADCAICHEAQYRASFVADLHNLKVPTNPDFWQTWIAHGKPGSFMPAFSQTDGGPLSDMQIASVAQYLNQAIPSKVAPAPQ